MKEEWKNYKVLLATKKATTNIETSYGNYKLIYHDSILINREVEEGKQSVLDVTKTWDKNNKYAARVDLEANNHMNYAHDNESRE